jgi:Mycothiol maleylpyruvate isomerase N-terminal domain
MTNEQPAGTPVVDRDQVWQVIDAHRRGLALLDDLGDDGWRRPSLCAGWTCGDVAVHLTLQQLAWPTCSAS